jgi:hypothetical protein
VIFDHIATPNVKAGTIKKVTLKVKVKVKVK